ncbi:MAG: hypothetical protein A2289_23820 [Deltaproteobacteria bacterium RIFOXYA12_FULL_58_15]|nr:MAG: hypothetical protein A2289_23820 [Deltaproteobacteria bacterium RIFOXYA12_FULL_58_15]OGR07773.1 MAG: hypothetical protein A2341_22385 [Deltaproteobacteria bacterium RIFOXYB12_FULL_58_9]
MGKRRDELRKQINEVWKQAISQLEDARDAVLRSGNRVETEVERLRMERDKLLKKLGEQTYKLANQGKLPMPTFIKETVDRLNEVIDNLLKKKKKSTSKGRKVTKKATTQNATKKTTKKRTTTKIS